VIKFASPNKDAFAAHPGCHAVRLTRLGTCHISRPCSVPVS